jgi:hypothetical protein
VKQPHDLKRLLNQKKIEVQKFLTSQILDNKINSRKELIEALQQHGEVKFLDMENLPPDPKTGKYSYDYISFIPEGSDRAMRLDGPMFKKNADFNELRIEHKTNQDMEKDDSLKQLSDKERTSKQDKLNKHKEIQKGFNEKLKTSGVKNVKKNAGRKYLPKIKQSKKLGNIKNISSVKNQPQKQSVQKSETALTVEDRQLQDPNVSGSIKDAMIAGEKAENEANKNEMAQEKKDQKVAKKPSDPIIIKNSDSKESKKSDSKPSISSFSQVATSSNASLFTVQINQVLFSKLSLELQIGSLSIFKESDIKKIFELKQKIAELDQQIAILKAKQEQAIEAELINQNANRFKNSGSSMKFRI